jgi:hypothetical protein
VRVMAPMAPVTAFSIFMPVFVSHGVEGRLEFRVQSSEFRFHNHCISAPNASFVSSSFPAAYAAICSLDRAD